MSQPDNEVLRTGHNLPALIGVDYAPIVSGLSELQHKESELVLQTLPEGAFAASDQNPGDNLVILPAARNALRASDDGATKNVFLHYQGQLFEAQPHVNSGTTAYRRQDGSMQFYKDTSAKTGVRNYTYFELTDGVRGRSRPISPTPITPWGFSEEGLAESEAAATQLAVLKQEFIAAHPLGEGALLVANRYGGIDPTDLESTAESLVARFYYANQLDITGAELVEHGLIEKHVWQLTGGSIARLQETIAPSLAMLEQLQQAGQDLTAVMPAIKNLVQGHIAEFLKVCGPTYNLAAQMLADPNLTDKVLNGLLTSDSGFKGVLQKSSIQNHRTR